jgi:hypothetical protein
VDAFRANEPECGVCRAVFIFACIGFTDIHMVIISEGGQ